jgi:hypothetical protein
MYRTIAIAGVTAAAIIGVGTAALAESGSTSGTPSPGSSASSGSTAGAGAHGAKGSRLGRLARHVVHGQFVTGTAGTFVTHDVIRGQVTAVSPSSIAVKAADGTSETFVVNSATKVRVRTSGKGAAGTISQVATGDDVLVLGTGAGTATAQHVLDVKK